RCGFAVLQSIYSYVLCGLLALLAADHLVVVADALALVRLRLLLRADVSRELADELLVEARDRERALVCRDGEAVGDHHLYRVAEAERQVEGLARNIPLEADA